MVPLGFLCGGTHLPLHTAALVPPRVYPVGGFLHRMLTCTGNDYRMLECNPSSKVCRSIQ